MMREQVGARDVSVVIPIHNAENFLIKTLKAVELAVEGLRAEIITVLDNSTDASGEIIAAEIAATKDSGCDITWLPLECHQGSIAASRNHGMARATGEYVAFCDHDDLVTARAYSKLIGHARVAAADVVRCGFSIKTKSENSVVMPRMGRDMYAFFGIFVWNAIYQRAFLERSGVTFKGGYGEDYQFNYEVGRRANKVEWLEEVLYQWVQHGDNHHLKRLPSDFLVRVEQLYIDNAEAFQNDPTSRNALFRFVADNCFHHATEFDANEVYEAYASNTIVRRICESAPFDYREFKRCVLAMSSIESRRNAAWYCKVPQGRASRLVNKIRRESNRITRQIKRLFPQRAAPSGNAAEPCSGPKRCAPAISASVVENSPTSVGFLVFDSDCISGGIISVFRLAELTRRLLPNGRAQIFTGPGGARVTAYTRFQNQERLKPGVELFEQIASGEIEVLHVPEVLLKWFCGEAIRRRADLSRLHVNILNQNDELMPPVSLTKEVGQRVRLLTQTTAHASYSSAEAFHRHSIPLTHISTYVSPEWYETVPFEKKENNILLSHDPHFRRDRVVGFLRGSMVGYETIVVLGIHYEDYLRLVAKSKFCVTLGEGLDNYFIETVFTGGLPFAIYNPTFMPAEMKHLPNVVLDPGELEDRIDVMMARCAIDREYRNEVWRRNYDVLAQMYVYSYHVEKLSRFYAGKYDWC